MQTLCSRSESTIPLTLVLSNSVKTNPRREKVERARAKENVKEKNKKYTFFFFFLKKKGFYSPKGPLQVSHCHQKLWL